MNDPNLEKAQRRALLTLTPDGNAQLEKELTEEKRHNESLQRISAIEKISSELQESNKLYQSEIATHEIQIKEAQIDQKRANRRGWIQFAISTLIALAALAVSILAIFK